MPANTNQQLMLTRQQSLQRSQIDEGARQQIRGSFIFLHRNNQEKHLHLYQMMPIRPQNPRGASENIRFPEEEQKKKNQISFL